MNYLDNPKIAKFTSEIHWFNEQGIKVSIEVGKRLDEAKSEFVTSDEWMNWAESQFGYKKSQAYKLVAIAKRFHSSGNSLEGKTINEVYALTAFDDEELEIPVQIPSGETKTPIEMSQKEIEQYKREKAEAGRAAQQAQQEADRYKNESHYYQKLWNQEKSKPNQVVIEKEKVVPDDYQNLKKMAIDHQRLNEENVKLQRTLLEQREKYEQLLTQEDKRKAVYKDLKKYCTELLQQQSAYSESILYNLSIYPGDREAHQLIEAFSVQYGREYMAFMNQIKQITTVRTVS